MMTSEDNDGNKHKDAQSNHTKHSENCRCKGGSGNGTPKIEMEEPE